MAARLSKQTLAERIVESAEALAEAAAPAAETEPARDIEALLAEEEAKHQNLADRAHKITEQAAGLLPKRYPTLWHIDKEPPIDGLPDGINVYYRIVPGEADYWSYNTVRVLLETEDYCTAEEGDLAHLGYRDRKMPVTATIDGQTARFQSGAVKAQADGGLPPGLEAMDSASADFALIERAVGVVEQAENEQRERQLLRARATGTGEDLLM